MDESDKKKQSLLDDLLKSVKECQIRFGGKSELATENEDVISSLCSKFEAILNHGLKTNHDLALSTSGAAGPGSSLKDKFTQFTAGGSPSSPNNHLKKRSPWPFIRLHLNRHELERYMLLRQVTSDSGRAKAWLRSSLNEHSLERYFHILISDQDNLTQFYEKFSFMKDSERVAVLPQMAAGLSSILFAIKIDNEALNHDPDDVNDTEKSNELVAVQKIKKPALNQVKKHQRKKSSTAAQVISFDEEEIKAKLLSSVNKDLPVIDHEIHSYGGIRSSSDTMDRMPSPSMAFDDVHLDSTQPSSNNNEDNDGYKSPSDALSILSIDTNSGHEDSVTKLTPMKNSEIGALIPLGLHGNSQDDCDVMSEDSMSIKSFGDDQDYASALSSITATPQPPPVPPPPFHQNHVQHPVPVYYRQSSAVSSVASAHNSTLSREDLKQALLSVMERKEELQEQYQSLKKVLEKESTVTSNLKQDLDESNRKSKENSDKMQARINSILRENELLKHQLKKYVGAVQKLRDGPQAHETLAQLEGQANKNKGDDKYVDYHFEASEYEKKLIQVAEMHGELLEFNEHLQKLLQSKDMLIKRLRDELVDLRGPLPDTLEEDQDDETLSIISDSNESNAGSSGRTLINIWIPSVFLSGSGSGGTHHVYQVYLRIRDAEWNIYRRYSEFYALHRDLQKKDKLVAAFDFPPKKTVGNKSEKFVEDRRKRLQTYLRQIVNLLVQSNPSLSAKPDKEQVILLMPFFAENSHLRHSANSERNQGLPTHQRPPLFVRRRSGNNRNHEPSTQLAI